MRVQIGIERAEAIHLHPADPVEQNEELQERLDTLPTVVYHWDFEQYLKNPSLKSIEEVKKCPISSLLSYLLHFWSRSKVKGEKNPCPSPVNIQRFQLEETNAAR